ncbi:MAG: hypothetical protein ACFCA4_02685 [Cyanophyceae cyanobacterium]
MGKRPILQKEQSYTFRSYFEMPYEADEILAEFDYALKKTRLTLPQTTQPLDYLPALQERIEGTLPFISLSNEAARRETLVSPIMLEVVRDCQCQMRIEYPLTVNNWLKGNFDYLLRSQNSLLVVEAKNDDLTRGFTQLAVELVALSHVEDQAVLYGAVTMGDIWRFGQLNRDTKEITQDLNLFKIPDDLAPLLKSILGILRKV